MDIANTRLIINLLNLSVSDVADIIIAAGTIAGLAGIVVAIKSIRISSRREAALQACQQLDEFREKIIPETSIARLEKFTFADFPKVANFNFTMKECVESEQTIRSSAEKLNNYRYENPFTSKQENLQITVTNIENFLESFSARFTHGVADEKIAFTSISKIFCDFVEKYWFTYCEVRNGSPADLFDSTIKLYRLWKTRMRKSLKEHVIKKLKKSVASDNRELRQNDQAISEIIGD